MLNRNPKDYLASVLSIENSLNILHSCTSFLIETHMFCLNDMKFRTNSNRHMWRSS